MKILTFITIWFCGDQEKGLPPLGLVSISDLISSVASTRKNLIGKVVSEMNMC